jgi:dTDP-4-dehydrorhamnose reductase
MASDSTNKVLITGGGGLLGRSAAARFSQSGWHVVSFSKADLDISNEAAVLELIDRIEPGFVINCAAATDVDRCEREPAWAYEANELGPRLLARACRNQGASLVHISTDYVFDGQKDGFYTQDDKPNPQSVYAKSKLAGELAVTAELGERAYIVRSSWIFGAGGKNFGSRVVDFARSGAKLKGVIDQFSIPTYAPDLAARIVEIAHRGVSGLYQVTNTGAATWMGFARMALDLAGLGNVEISPVTRAELAQPAPRPHNSAMRCVLSEQLGFTPLRAWQEALTEFIHQLCLPASLQNTTGGTWLDH